MLHVNTIDLMATRSYKKVSQVKKAKSFFSKKNFTFLTLQQIVQVQKETARLGNFILKLKKKEEINFR
jgi:hypothetical protein